MGSSNSFPEFNSLATMTIVTIPFWTIILQALVSGQPVCKTEKKWLAFGAKLLNQI
jgi:hypothetical protein